MPEKLPENGDDEFEKFLNDNSDTCSNVSLLFLTLREKTKFLTGLYNTSLGAYLKLSEPDPLRAELLQHIKRLMDYSFRCLEQFDFSITDCYPDDDDDDDDASDFGNNLTEPPTNPSEL